MPFRAIQMIVFSPKLLTLSLLPCLLTFAVMGTVVYLVATGAGSALTAWAMQYGSWAVTSSYIAQTIAVLGLIYLSFHLLVFFLSLIAIPFSDALSQATERELKIEPAPGSGLGHYSRLMILDVIKTLFLMAAALICTLGSWIPMVGIVFMIALSFMNTLNFVSYAQTRRGMGIIAALSWLKKNWAGALGFGIVVSLLFAIPVVNFFALPVCVVAGTILNFDRLK